MALELANSSFSETKDGSMLVFKLGVVCDVVVFVIAGIVLKEVTSEVEDSVVEEEDSFSVSKEEWG